MILHSFARYKSHIFRYLIETGGTVQVIFRTHQWGSMIFTRGPELHGIYHCMPAIMSIPMGITQGPQFAPVISGYSACRCARNSSFTRRGLALPPVAFMI